MKEKEKERENRWKEGMRVFVGVVSKSSGVMVHGFLNLWTPSCFCTTLGIY
jgi:hypothetical protein